MSRHILPALAVFAVLAATATAQTYSVEPGLWEAEGQAALAGTPLPVEGTECLSQDDARINLDEVLAEAGLGDCDLDTSSRVGNTTNFSLSCAGEPSFSASGTLTVQRKEVRVEADGLVLMEGLGEVPASIDVTARRSGSC